ncbi:MAG: hypothetical protein H6822_01480 [Planctomycetaceae bacterium]|nr:hypothetical protein [Planctomycetales bacterium]MCB9920818.1 hypothetical protein [Planctomycetaceae bacterium]
MHGSSAANFPLIIISILSTAVFWGTYGPFLQWGHGEMGSGRMRPFICVGIAYLMVAVVGPILVIAVFGMEKGEGLFHGWTMSGIWWSFIAGVVGALGALGMLLAFNFGGKPHYVPPLIFGLAPVVNAFFTISMNPQLREQLGQNVLRSSFFGAGLLMVAVGAVTVLVAAPKGGPPKHAPAPEVSEVEAESAVEEETPQPADDNSNEDSDQQEKSEE